MPGAPACAVAATGNAVATATTLTGVLDVTFTSCESLNLASPASDLLVLNRQ